MPELDGKVALVTGANSGIGLEASVGLARLGARVLLACRNPAKAAAAQREIISRSGRDSVEIVPLDLASLASVRACAAAVRERTDHLDVLLNNAGLVVRKRSTTSDGLETTFGVNHVGHFLLTAELDGLLRATPHARVVNVSSDAHKFVGRGIPFDDLQHERHYSPFIVYGRSKLANILFTRELARRLAGSGVTANCLHPGFVASNFGRDDRLGNVAMQLGRPFAISAERGARTSIFLASSPTVSGASGGFYYKCALRTPSAKARDDAAAARLWSVTEALIAERS